MRRLFLFFNGLSSFLTNAYRFIGSMNVLVPLSTVGRTSCVARPIWSQGERHRGPHLPGGPAPTRENNGRPANPAAVTQR